MKHTLWLFALAAGALAGCHGSAQDEAQQTAEAIRQTVQANRPGQVATSDGGYAMRATIDGRPWRADGMMEINASNEHFIQGSGGDVVLGFYIDTEHAVQGRERPLNEGHTVDLTVGDGSWHAIDGGYTLDKVAPALIEGRFHFTAQKFQSGQTLEVADGRFRAVPGSGG